MAFFDFNALGTLVSEQAACGPDLDIEGDADYMNFVARAEGVLPTTFFSGPDGKPFDRTTIDFKAEFNAIGPLLQRTRDLRLLVFLAKLLVLNRDLAGFVRCIELIATLVKDRWEEVHPRATDGDFGIRMASLESLDDLPPVVFPLQYLPLMNHRRLGPVTFRNWMIATGEAKPREGEEILVPAAIESALMEEDLAALVEQRDRFQALQSALESIRETCVDRVGAEYAVKLERLPTLSGRILVLLDGIATRRDPSLASAVADSAGTPAGSAEAPYSLPAGAVASMADVAAALAAVGRYFNRSEPSNPALLLVRQAEGLMGKSFLEVMRVLVPNHVEQAAIQIGKDQLFDLPLERLAPFAEITAVEQGADEEPSTEQMTPTAADSSRIDAKTRADAIRLLDQIASYYRVAEPSSPIPFLTDRARGLAERDFVSLLKDMLPGDVLKGNTSG
jgi:type VI secretion system protein ImpA